MNDQNEFDKLQTQASKVDENKVEEQYFTNRPLSSTRSKHVNTLEDGDL